MGIFWYIEVLDYIIAHCTTSSEFLDRIYILYYTITDVTTAENAIVFYYLEMIENL